MFNLREAVVPRFGSGALVEFDFSQIEVYALAILSGDKTLQNDLLSGIDLHRTRAAMWLKKDPSKVTPEERRKAKVMTFQLQYGSGAANMARSLNIPQTEAVEFIYAYYKRYPEIARMHALYTKEILETSDYTDGDKSSRGIPCRRGILTMAWGKVYTFIECDIPWRPGDVDFSPTEIANYPVQGLAMDIMHIFLAQLGPLLAKYPKILLVNAVHDSVLFDVPITEIPTLTENIVLPALQAVPLIFKQKLDFDLGMPILMDGAVGMPSWDDMHPLVRLSSTEGITDKRVYAENLSLTQDKLLL